MGGLLVQTHCEADKTPPSEWFMGVAAIGGYENTNGRAMDLWEAVYPNALLVALTDTFSTEAFYQVRPITTIPQLELNMFVAGLRQRPREGQKVDWVETGLRRPFCVCPTGTGNIPINEHRPHFEGNCLFRRAECGKGVGA